MGFVLNVSRPRVATCNRRRSEIARSCGNSLTSKKYEACLISLHLVGETRCTGDANVAVLVNRTAVEEVPAATSLPKEVFASARAAQWYAALAALTVPPL